MVSLSVKNQTIILVPLVQEIFKVSCSVTPCYLVILSGGEYHLTDTKFGHGSSLGQQKHHEVLCLTFDHEFQELTRHICLFFSLDHDNWKTTQCLLLQHDFWNEEGKKMQLICNNFQEQEISPFCSNCDFVSTCYYTTTYIARCFNCID